MAGRGVADYYELTSGFTASYKDKTIDFGKSVSYDHLKIDVVGGSIRFKLNGPDDNDVTGDGLIDPADGLVTFNGLELHQISIKQVSGTVTRVRIWVW